MVWDGLRTNTLPEFCEVLNEDFSSGFNEKVWTKEAEVGGYGNGQFEETTQTEENVFVQDGMLVIKPTLHHQPHEARDLYRSQPDVVKLCR